MVVNFNETLDVAEAETASNFSIGGLSVSSATLLPGDRSVRLTTSAMTNGADYTLTVNNVQDTALNTIAPGSTVDFSFFETMTVAFQDGMAPTVDYAGTRDAYFREVAPDTHYGFATSWADALFGTQFPDWIPVAERVYEGKALTKLNEKLEPRASG